METTSPTEPHLLRDPRSRQIVFAQYLPLCNGKTPPNPDAKGANDKIVLEFLAVYYDLNCAHSNLLEVRGSPASADRSEAERQRLREVEKVLIVRDGLEDRYAPCGVIAQPVVKDGFTVDIRFSFGNADSRGRPRTDLFRMAVEIPIPLPPGAKLEDYIVGFQGPEPFMPLPD